MNSPQNHFEHFYDDQVGATFRQVPSAPRIIDRLSDPSVVLTVLAVLVTIFFKVNDLEFSLDVFTHVAGTYLWDFLVFIVPTPLLAALDRWLNPSTDPTAMTQSPTTHAAKSELMKSVMGLDRSGGMMSSVFQARTRALSVTSSVLGLKLDPERPAGLGNRDNSCYQNSILQGLAALPSFPEYLASCVRAVALQQPNKDVAHTLQALIADLNDTSNNGRTIWTPGLLKSMSTWTQQDAQEYYSKVLDDIDKNVARAVKTMRRYSGLEADCGGQADMTASEHSDDSGYQSVSSSPELKAQKTLRNPLEGLLAQRVACVQCGYSEGLSMIPFNCLTLSLGLDKHQHDLYERLDSYTKVEAIEGVECPKCTLLKAQRLLTKLVEKLKESGSSTEQLSEPLRRLEAVELALEEDDFEEKTLTEECKISSQGKVNSTKTKQIVIARPPQSLAVHVNRSVFDPRTFDMIKNSAPVSFPLTLDLGPWCLGSAEELSEKLANLGESQEQWLLDPKSSMVAGDLSPSRLTGPIYELRAAVTHYGRHENGHYICYRRYPKTDGPQDDEATEAVVDDTIDDDDDETYETGDEKAPFRHARNGGWWRLSDHNVSRVNEETVLSLSPGVFMLFYECVDPSMVLQSEAASMVDAVESKQEQEAQEAVEAVEDSTNDAMSEGHADTDDLATITTASVVSDDATQHSDTTLTDISTNASTVSEDAYNKLDEVYEPSSPVADVPTENGPNPVNVGADRVMASN